MQTLVSTGLWGGGRHEGCTMHFKVIRGGLLLTSPPPFLRPWKQNPARHRVYILTGKVGNFLSVLSGIGILRSEKLPTF